MEPTVRDDRQFKKILPNIRRNISPRTSSNTIADGIDRDLIGNGICASNSVVDRDWFFFCCCRCGRRAGREWALELSEDVVDMVALLIVDEFNM
jgi:hypothetical protein